MLRWFDGAELWGSAGYLGQTYADAAGTTSATPGRVSPGTRYLSMNGGRLKTPALGLTNEWYVGFGSLPSDIPTSQRVSIRAFTGAAEQCALRLYANGGLAEWRLYRGATLIDTSSTFALNIWHFFELKLIVRDGTDGAYELRRNQQVIMSGSGVNIANDATDGADSFGFGYGESGSGTGFDDIYILDTDNSDGAGNITFLGEVAEVGRLPDGDGHQVDFIKSTGATNFENVDDPATALDSDYNHSDVTGDEDYYTFANLPTTGLGQIFGLKLTASLAMANTGTRTAQYRYYNGMTEFDVGDDNVVAGTSVVEFPQISAINPDTGLAWTATDINAGEFGVKVEA